MNPQSDPTPGLRLPQPSINSGAAQPFMTPAQSPIQTPAVHPQVQAMATQPLQQNVPNSRPEHHAQPEVSVAQAQVASVMHTSTPETEPMINPNIPVQSSQPAAQYSPQISDEPAQPTPAVAPPADENDDSADEQWVEKAKVTINQYKTDPYMQSKAFSRLKAEYMQTRHNKTLKVDE